MMFPIASRAMDRDCVFTVRRDDIPLGQIAHAVAVGADPVTRCADEDAYSVARISKGGLTRRIGADVVPCDYIEGADCAEPSTKVARDHVSLTEIVYAVAVGADGVAWCIADGYPKALVAERHGAAHIRAEVVALDHVVSGECGDCVDPEPIDCQSADRTVACLKAQSGGDDAG